MRPGKIRLLFVVIAFIVFVDFIHAQTAVQVTVHTGSPQFRIPADFVGLGFETKSVVPDTYGVHGYFFSPDNRQLITLFRNIGIRNIRVGGGTVDASGANEHCAMPTPTIKDIDNLFEFARAAEVKVIYSVRLLNMASCTSPDLMDDDAKLVRYIWTNYRDEVDSFAIGNEPDVRSYHSRPGHVIDPAIYESTPGVSGSAYPSYVSDWLRFAKVIREAAPEAKFSGPDTAVSDTSSFTPNRSEGVSWTQHFVADLKGSGMLKAALQHHYVWGGPRNTTVPEAIDDMLSSRWDDDTSVGMQPAFDGGEAAFHPYPFVYARVLEPVVRDGIPYRMTEANDCLHGVHGASDGFASALWALDYMHWWAAHHMAGVNFHNNPWLPTDTIVPDPNPCASSGCGRYRVTPKALGMKAFSLGSRGYVEPVTIDNPEKMNLTAYAVGTKKELYVTIINKTHTTTHDVTDALVRIKAPGFDRADVDSIVLTGGEPGDAALMTGTLGGGAISNNSPWAGKWTPLAHMQAARITVKVRSTTAVVVRIRETAPTSTSKAKINNNEEMARRTIARR